MTIRGVQVDVDGGNLSRVAEWLDGGSQAIMMITSALHHPAVDGNYCDEQRALIADMPPWDMAMTMTWLALMGADALVAKHDGDRDAAFEELRTVALQLHDARSAGVEQGDVGV